MVAGVAVCVCVLVFGLPPSFSLFVLVPLCAFPVAAFGCQSLCVQPWLNPRLYTGIGGIYMVSACSRLERSR